MNDAAAFVGWDLGEAEGLLYGSPCPRVVIVRGARESRPARPRLVVAVSDVAGDRSSAQSTEALSRGSPQQPKPIRARMRLPLRQ